MKYLKSLHFSGTTLVDILHTYDFINLQVLFHYDGIIHERLAQS